MADASSAAEAATGAGGCGGGGGGAVEPQVDGDGDIGGTCSTQQHHLAEHLRVGPSQLGDTAGDGVFVDCAVPRGTVICEYRGESHDTFNAMRLEDKSYLMRLGQDSYIDAKNLPHVLARYINDCRNPCLYNVEFQKRPEQGFALVVATRDILANEELWVDYGKWYWLKLKPRRLAPRLAHELLQRVSAAPPQKAWTRWTPTPLPAPAPASASGGGGGGDQDGERVGEAGGATQGDVAAVGGDGSSAIATDNGAGDSAAATAAAAAAAAAPAAAQPESAE